ncbi:MAG: hypothetical protein R3C59_08530 [Planctomycetaceae bacterium]
MTGSRNDSTQRGRATLCAAWLLLLLAGCGPEARIREYTIDSESEKVFTSDLLRDEFGSIPFEWDVPKEWTIADNDQFSKVAWQVGPKGQESRITLSDLPIAAGLVPQLTRWRGQIQIEQSSTDDPMDGTERMTIGDRDATYVDFKGPEATILGLLVPLESKLWIFKFRGDNKIADGQRDTFRKFAESVKVP